MPNSGTAKNRRAARVELYGKIFGLSPKRTWWGFRPHDLGLWRCFPSKRKSREEWYEDNHVPGHGHGGGSYWDTPWHVVPSVRHAWGETQHEVHPGGQELFLDLIFVGIAYRVGQVMKSCFYSCTPPGDVSGSGSSAASASGSIVSSGGRVLASYAVENECLDLGRTMLHSLAPYICMYTLWEIEKRHRAMFAVTSKVHAFLDILNDFMLILAAMNVQPANSYRESRTSDLGLGRVLVPILVAFAVWMYRIAEIAFLSPRENARMQQATDLLTCFQLLVFWILALTLSVVDFGDADTNGTTSDLAALLMVMGNVWWLWKMALKTIVDLCLPGSLPLEQQAVCANTGFVIHRNNEFMFLMLGETVLQIVVAVAPGSTPQDVNPFVNKLTATAACGFILAATMMFSFRSMVRGQLDNYERTNLGLGQQSKETDKLLQQVQATQKPGGRSPSRPDTSQPPQAVAAHQPRRSSFGKTPSVIHSAAPNPQPSSGNLRPSPPSTPPPTHPPTLSTGGSRTDVHSPLYERVADDSKPSQSFSPLPEPGPNPLAAGSSRALVGQGRSPGAVGAASPSERAVIAAGDESSNGGAVTVTADGTSAAAAQDSSTTAQQKPRGEGRKQIGNGGGHRSSLLKRMVDTTALDQRYESKAERILAKMHLYNLLNSLLWETKALSVMLVGVGVKLAIYMPDASPNAHFAFEQRLEVGLGLGICFFVQLFHTVFVKSRHHYSWQTIPSQPIHYLVLFTRLSLIIACPLVSLIPVQPLYILVMLAGLAVAQCAMMQIHEFKANIRSQKLHPMRELPNALLALQNKRRRLRDAKTGGNQPRGVSRLDSTLAKV